MKMITRNKNINLLVYAFMILALQFGFIMNVNADGDPFFKVDSSNKGKTDPNSSLITNQATLEITGVVAEDTFKAYKILDAFYNETTNTVTYDFTDSFKASLKANSNESFTVEDYYDLTSGSHTSGSVTTTSTLDTLISTYATYIKATSVPGVDMQGTGTTRSATLNAGAYLVLPTSTKKVYAVMVGNLDFETENGNWKINNETIVAKVSDPAVATKSINEKGRTSNSFNIGQEYSYIITGTVPQYPTNAINKTYKVIDTMSAGIDFGGINTIKVEDGTTALTVDASGNITNASGNKVGQITIADKTITFDFDLNYITSTLITITYKAKLNTSAALGSTGNTNTATLTYSNDPYANLTTTTEPKDGETFAYTYGLRILKYGGTDKSQLLGGAAFEIYSDAALSNKIGEFTTTDGIGTYVGLASGNYYLKETTAPAGYSLLKDAIAVKVANGSAVEDTENPGYYYAEIANSKTGILPFTGGVGTYFYTLAGLLIIAFGTTSYIIYRKNKRDFANNEE